MSGAPKRMHEEGSHSILAKRPLDDSSSYLSPSGKSVQPGSSDFHGSFEHDGRFAKVQRIEPRDDKPRSSLSHRMPLGSSNLADHPISSDNRLESKQNKDAREAKVDDHDSKVDARDAYNDSRVEFQGNKVESDVKVDNRVDESEIRADRRSHSDHKGDTKFEKDSHPSLPSHVGWKDNKDHRGKRYFEPPADNMDWRFSRPGMQGSDETPKVSTPVEERNSRDTHYSAGDNKADPKSEDKFRDKDRKKKEEKHGARESDRNDRRISMQLGGSSIERREMQREDRDAEKWDREKKDSQKEKEGNARDKDSAKKESSVVNEKETTVLEKSISDGAVKVAEHENATTDSKALKDDTWKAHDMDSKDKKREKDVDAGDRHDQRSKHNDKESDDNGAEGDKDVFGNVQRKRISRPRGGSQASQREPRFRPKMRDGEG
ncbi:hypothetical protein PR202_gb26637 [Eleusine coracana subsp. coracana]|uniref:Uncharacterized protein n=1 Tax=Eleusine coracana subsp. coracana TaxID=191504 RepID=A0AAV5FSB8_ELECO|nr:hypothetical protein PR202_gb26637 [Eleusine coracana subsp. coracana]